jgi:hypothetical protein
MVAMMEFCVRYRVKAGQRRSILLAKVRKSSIDEVMLERILENDAECLPGTKWACKLRMGMAVHPQQEQQQRQQCDITCVIMSPYHWEGT